ncbi:hypothetical protein NQ317_001413 [Molorchus minor]|uniref:Uncharacterized protein n=1 Tax=Molorchus minor TaxID=1323400 RepID=A0ABQ9K043_9CUCU|nr:hypothetical protein NQ317_001413 [Molorchus minor]
MAIKVANSKFGSVYSIDYAKELCMSDFFRHLFSKLEIEEEDVLKNIPTYKCQMKCEGHFLQID